MLLPQCRQCEQDVAKELKRSIPFSCTNTTTRWCSPIWTSVYNIAGTCWTYSGQIAPASAFWILIGIFSDCAALYQLPRSDAQTIAFKRALKNIKCWYASIETHVRKFVSSPSTLLQKLKRSIFVFMYKHNDEMVFADLDFSVQHCWKLLDLFRTNSDSIRVLDLSYNQGMQCKLESILERMSVR